MNKDDNKIDTNAPTANTTEELTSAEDHQDAPTIDPLVSHHEEQASAPTNSEEQASAPTTSEEHKAEVPMLEQQEFSDHEEHIKEENTAPTISEEHKAKHNNIKEISDRRNSNQRDQSNIVKVINNDQTLDSRKRWIQMSPLVTTSRRFFKEM